MTNIKNPYCWVCYKNGSEVFCSKCEISFHLECFGDNFQDIWESASYKDEVIYIKECQECLKMMESRRLYISMKKQLMKFKRLPEQLLNSILGMIITKGIGIQPFDEMMKTWLKNEEFKKNVSPIINTINSKLLTNAYTCSGEFLFDNKKIRHMVKSHMSQHVSRFVDSYTEKIQENCQEMDICPYCVSNYLTKSNGSIELCPWGHRLVLVDLSQGLHFEHGNRNIKRLENLPPVFPAKILRYERDNNGLIVVRHFGSLMSIRVPKSCVYLLRSVDIVQLRRLTPFLPVIEVREELENSLKMVEFHLMKLRSVYGNSSLLADRKRLWHMKDGYFYSRQTSMFKIPPESSKGYTLEPEPNEDDHDEEINLNVQHYSKSLNCQEDNIEALHTSSPLSEDSADQENISERMDMVPSPQSFVEITDIAEVEITDTALVEMVSCTPDLMIPEENQESYPNITFSSSDDRVQFDNSFEEVPTIEMTDSNEIKPTIVILINQSTSETSPILIDLTQDDEEDEVSKVLPEIEVNRPSVIISPLDLRKRKDFPKISSNESYQINPKHAEANLRIALDDSTRGASGSQSTI